MNRLNRRSRCSEVLFKPLAVCCLALVFWSLALARSDEVPKAPQASENETQSDSQDRVASLGLNLPMAIGVQEVAWYFSTLQLDETQHQIAMSFLGQYSRDYESIEGRHLPELQRRAREVASRPDRLSQDGAMATLEVYSDRKELIGRLAGADERLFAQIATILADTQLAALERVRNSRLRQRYALMSIDYPGASIDLAFMLYLIKHELTFVPTDATVFEALLVEYETRRTQFVLQHVHEVERARAEEKRLQIESIERPHDAEEIYHEFRRLAGGIARKARQLHDLNARSVEAISGYLPAGPAEMLRDRFRRQAYPEVYPDPFDVSELLRLTMESPSLADSQRSELIQIADAYENSADTISQQMVRELLDLRGQFAETRVWDDRGFARHVEVMSKLQNQRREAASIVLDAMNELVGGQLPVHVAHAVALYESEAADHRPRELGIHFFP